MIFRKTYEKGRFDFHDARCIEAECWAPGMYQHRGAGGAGSRNTGSPDSPCCLNRAYRGCPNDVIYKIDLARARRAEGWKRG